MSKPIFWKKKKEEKANIINLSSDEFAKEW